MQTEKIKLALESLSESELCFYEERLAIIVLENGFSEEAAQRIALQQTEEFFHPKSAVKPSNAIDFGALDGDEFAPSTGAASSPEPRREVVTEHRRRAIRERGLTIVDAGSVGSSPRPSSLGQTGNAPIKPSRPGVIRNQAPVIPGNKSPQPERTLAAPVRPGSVPAHSAPVRPGARIPSPQASAAAPVLPEKAGRAAPPPRPAPPPKPPVIAQAAPTVSPAQIKEAKARMDAMTRQHFEREEDMSGPSPGQ